MTPQQHELAMQIKNFIDSYDENFLLFVIIIILLLK